VGMGTAKDGRTRNLDYGGPCLSLHLTKSPHQLTNAYGVYAIGFSKCCVEACMKDNKTCLASRQRRADGPLSTPERPLLTASSSTVSKPREYTVVPRAKPGLLDVPISYSMAIAVLQKQMDSGRVCDASLNWSGMIHNTRLFLKLAL
jgi:hypothetical protein